MAPGGLSWGILSYGVGAGRSLPPPLASPAGTAGEWLESGPGPSLLGVTRKISGTPMSGSVTAFRLSPDGTKAVFIADKDTLGRFELYAAPVSGSTAPVKISTGVTFGSGDNGVSSFQITPDSTRVVFLADPNTGGGIDEIFSAPIDGSSAALRLSVSGTAPVTTFGIAPGGASVVYFGNDTAFGGGNVEVYRATIGVASSGVQLSDVSQLNAAGNVVAARISPDSARVIYAGDASADNVFQWHSAPLAAAGPGADVQLSAALGSVALVRISPDSSRVVYTADENVVGRMEVFSTPIAGGTRIQLNPAMAGDGATAIEISPDGTRVGYLADQTTAGVNEVHGALMLVAGSGIRLNTPMSGTQYADTLNIGPDGATVLYEADQTTPGTYELYRVPIDASGPPSNLHPLTAPSDAGYFAELGTPIIGRRAVYPVFGAAVDLFSVPFDGSGPYEQINDPLAAGDTLFNVFLPAAGTRLMAYGSGPSTGAAARKVFAAPIRSDLPVEQVNVTAAAGSLGVQGYEISSNQAYAVYLQDQDTGGKPELYSRELDSDADTVINAADNCPFVANPAQTAVVFPATVLALNTTTFTWGTRLDARFVRGPLTTVSSLVTNASGTLTDATGYVDPVSPAASSGFWYLFAPDCPGRSYQSALGEEPARDLAAFP